MQSNSSNKNSGINSSENKGHSLAAERRAKLAKLRQALSLQDRDITSAPSLTKVDEFQERYGAADKRNGLVNEPDTPINDGTHKIFYNETQVNGREERNRKYTDTGSILTEDTDFEDESSPPSSPSRGTSASTLSARTAIIKSPASDSTDSSGRVGSSTVKVYQNGQYINSMEDLGYQSSISSPNDKRYSPQESKKMSLLKVERSVDTFSQSLPETFFKTVKLDLSQSVGLPSGDAITKSKVLYDPRIFRKDCATVDQIPELDIGDDETEKEYFERMTKMNNVGGAEDSFIGATARTPKFSVSSGQVEINMSSNGGTNNSRRQDLNLGKLSGSMRHPGEPSPGLECIDLGDPVHSARSQREHTRSPTLSCRTEFTDPDHRGRSGLKNRNKSFGSILKNKFLGKSNRNRQPATLSGSMRSDLSESWGPSDKSVKVAPCQECSHRKTTSCYTTLLLLAVDIFTICLVVALIKHQNGVRYGQQQPLRAANISDLGMNQTVQGKALPSGANQDPVGFGETESTTSNGKTDVEILLDKINNLTERVQKLEKPPVFACHRTSSLLPGFSKRATVTYDRCSIATPDMEAAAGTFTGREKGMYQFTFSALFVALGGEVVHADLILRRLHDGIPVVIGRSTAKLNEKSMVGKARSFFGLDDEGSSTDELHTTSSMIVFEEINPGDQVYIEVTVEDKAHLNSDAKKKIHFTGVKISN